MESLPPGDWTAQVLVEENSEEVVMVQKRLHVESLPPGDWMHDHSCAIKTLKNGGLKY